MVLNLMRLASWYRLEEKLLGKEMTLAINPYSHQLCGIWHRFVETTYPPSRILQYQAKKVGYHMTITLRIVSCSLVVFEEVRSNHTFGPKSNQTVTFSVCNGLSSITSGFSGSQIWQFCLLTYPPSVKFASPLKKM